MQIIGKWNDEEQKALESNNDKEAFKYFSMEAEKLAQESQTTRTIFGYVNKGDANFNIISSMRNFNDDPFIKDVMSTITTMTAIYKVGTTISDMMADKKLIDEKNAEINSANSTNKANNAEIASSSKEIKSQQSVNAEYAEHSARVTGDTVGPAREEEALARVDSQFATRRKEYVAYDNIGSHAQVDVKIEQENKDMITTLSNGLGNGTMGPDVAYKIATEQYQRNYEYLMEVCNDIVKTNKTVSTAGANYLNLAQEIIQNKGAVEGMWSALQDQQNIGDVLAKMQFVDYQQLAALPNDMRTVLFQAVSGYVMVSHLKGQLEPMKNVTLDDQNKAMLNKFANGISEDEINAIAEQLLNENEYSNEETNGVSR